MDKQIFSEILDAVYANNPLALAVFDMDMCYLYASDKWYEQYNIKNRNIIGKSHYEVFPEFLDMPEMMEVHKRVLNGETLQGDRDRIVRQDGTVQYQRWIMKPWYFPNTNTQGGAFIYTEDITNRVMLEQDKNNLIEHLKFEIQQRKAIEEKLQRQAITDELTGLFNRRHFYNLIHNEMERVNRYSGSLSIYLMDIDDFKSINDSYGHDTGDKILKNIAQLLLENIRSTDLLCRWGGEEFIVLLPGTSEDAALELAERIRQNIDKHTFPKVGRVSMSIGVASYEKGSSLEKLIRCADKALYKAKSEGKNRVIQYRSS